jgi:hypothetical protein
MIEPLESRRLLASSISGTVFNDANANSIDNAGEVGLKNEIVYLDLNFDGSFDGNDLAQTTDSHGQFDFTNLTAGVYRVSVVVPSGFRQTSPGQVFYDVAANGINDIHTGENFGLTNTGIIRGNVFDDMNDDGVKDVIDQGISGITIFIDKNKNGHLDKGELAVTTDANGNYRLSALAPGTYVVRIGVPKGFSATTTNVLHITLHSGQSLSNRNFGLIST